VGGTSALGLFLKYRRVAIVGLHLILAGVSNYVAFWLRLMVRFPTIHGTSSSNGSSACVDSRIRVHPVSPLRGALAVHEHLGPASLVEACLPALWRSI